MSTVISQRKRFVFIHINKTGGTSITSLLGQYEEWPVCKRLYRAVQRRFLPRSYRAFSCCGQHFVSGHASAKTVRKTLGVKRFDEFYKFAVVRNPWDREVSRYFYARKTPSHHLHNMANRFEFAEFIKQRGDEATGKGVRGYQFKKVSDGKGNLLVDTIVRIENLAEEIAPVFSRIGIDGLDLIPQLNRSSHRPYQEYYDAESIQLVRDICRDDIDRFGYSFEQS